MQSERIVREPERRKITGIPTSSWYDLIHNGLAPQAVKLSEYTAGWPYTELTALNAAKIAGKSNDEIRTLVTKLMTARKHAFDKFEAA